MIRILIACSIKIDLASPQRKSFNFYNPYSEWNLSTFTKPLKLEIFLQSHLAGPFVGEERDPKSNHSHKALQILFHSHPFIWQCFRCMFTIFLLQASKTCLLNFSLYMGICFMLPRITNLLIGDTSSLDCSPYRT